MTSVPALLIGGTSSGCGKTTATLGLMAALVRQGLFVQGFKVGPDYIDPGLHRLVTGRPSWNLDSWMGGRRSVIATFSRVMAGNVWGAEGVPDIGVVEGVMGLFDGSGGMDDRGSSAEIAAWLDIPVVLVVNARGLARSIAALVKGFASMRADLRLGGVIATRVGSRNHADMLHEAMESACPGIPLLACLPLDEGVARPSRHLGLVTAEDSPLPLGRQEALAEWFSANADIGACIALAQGSGAWCETNATRRLPPPRARIAVARDEAFCFVYPAFLDALERAGAELIFFSPLHDAAVPDCDGIWLPGGYPELHAAKLSANTGMVRSLRTMAEKVPVHGECGGYVWLLESLDVDGTLYPMSGCLPGTARLGSRRAALGYRTVRLCGDHPLGAQGTRLRGHEFHYSQLLDAPDKAGVEPLWTVFERRDRELGNEGMRRGKVSGTWVHVHPDSDPEMAERFVQACAARP